MAERDRCLVRTSATSSLVMLLPPRAVVAPPLLRLERGGFNLCDEGTELGVGERG